MKSKMKKIEKTNETETGYLEGEKKNNKINIPLARWIKKKTQITNISNDTGKSAQIPNP